MSEYFSKDRIKFPNFFGRHKKAYYLWNKIRFKHLNDLVHPLKYRYPNLLLTPSTSICNDCYKFALKLVDGTDDEFDDIVVDVATENEVGDIEVDMDEDFLPSTPECIEEFNNEISTSFLGSMSPLKRKNLIREKFIENYVNQKKTKLISTFSSTLDAKLMTLYDVSVKSNESTTAPCHCTEWVQNNGLVLQKCSTVSEKIKILTLLPSSFAKHEILSLFPEITMYMINKSRNLVKEIEIYSEPYAYSGHPIDENMEKIVMEYYLNDDFNCSRQSLNNCGVVTIKLNNKKDKKVKRFLTRSLKETYKVFKNDNPELRTGKSKFYSLRPKYVLLSPIKEVCLCIYCANYDLFLTSLINFRGSNVTELDKSRHLIHVIYRNVKYV